jgi:hypothetical protein
MIPAGESRIIKIVFINPDGTGTWRILPIEGPSLTLLVGLSFLARIVSPRLTSECPANWELRQRCSALLRMLAGEPVCRVEAVGDLRASISGGGAASVAPSGGL